MLGRLRDKLRSLLPGVDDESGIWRSIPSRQYTGRHAESGGLSRDEQESAIQDVQRQVDELEDAQTPDDELEDAQ
jgi:hypothetical protein